MIKLKIINKNKYEYYLKDKEENNYIVRLDFYDIEKEPKIGDYIYFSKELLNSKYSGYSTRYTFGNIKSKYGKKNISIDDIDVIKVVIDKTEIYLKRLYG